MSDAFIRELDVKIQKIKEYSLISHGYHNETVQCPVHVRRSHDGEKLTRTSSIISKSSNNEGINQRLNTTMLTPSLHESQIKSKPNKLVKRQLSYNEYHTIPFVPPNKTVNDIKPSFNCDKLHTKRELPTHTSHTLTLPIKTLKQRFFSKFFHDSSKS